MKPKAQQAHGLEINHPESTRQLTAPLVIEAVKQTRYQVARRYGRVTIAEHEYFYVRAQDILVRSDVFHAYRKEGFQRLLDVIVGGVTDRSLPGGLIAEPARHHERD